MQNRWKQTLKASEGTKGFQRKSQRQYEIQIVEPETLISRDWDCSLFRLSLLPLCSYRDLPTNVRLRLHSLSKDGQLVVPLVLR